MATVLSCGAYHYVFTFKDIAPAEMAEREHCIQCPMCHAAYSILIRMIREPGIHPAKLEVVRNRPSV